MRAATDVCDCYSRGTWEIEIWGNMQCAFSCHMVFVQGMAHTQGTFQAAMDS